MVRDRDTVSVTVSDYCHLAGFFVVSHNIENFVQHKGNGTVYEKV